MRVEFDKMEEITMEHFKGGEGVMHAKMFTNELGKILMGRLEPGSSIGMHTHDTSSEIIYIFSGKAKVIDDGEEYFYGPGEVHYCPKGHSHTMISVGDEDLKIFAVIPEQ